VSRRFMGRPRGLFDLQQIFGQLFQHLPLQQELIHDERWACRANEGTELDSQGLAQPPAKPPFATGSFWPSTGLKAAERIVTLRLQSVRTGRHGHFSKRFMSMSSNVPILSKVGSKVCQSSLVVPAMETTARSMPEVPQKSE